MKVNIHRFSVAIDGTQVGSTPVFISEGEFVVTSLLFIAKSIVNCTQQLLAVKGSDYPGFFTQAQFNAGKVLYDLTPGGTPVPLVIPDNTEFSIEIESGNEAIADVYDFDVEVVGYYR